MVAYKQFPGMEGASYYYFGISKNPANQWLVTNHYKQFKSPPDFFTAGGFSAAMAVVTALKKTNGDTSTDKLITAMEGMSFDTPKGTMTFRKEDHQAMQSMYHFRVATRRSPGRDGRPAPGEGDQARRNERADPQQAVSGVGSRRQGRPPLFLIRLQYNPRAHGARAVVLPNHHRRQLNDVQIPSHPRRRRGRSPPARPTPRCNLPSYNVDTSKTTVSGLSSGGFMANQLGIAYSSTFKGVGVFAGGPYMCAGHSNYTALHVQRQRSAPRS